MTKSIVQLAILAFLCTAVKAQTLSVEQIVAAVKDLCQSPNGNGKLSEFKVSAGGDAKVKIKLADGKLGGEVSFARSEWEGVRKVLGEHQSAENANYRECVKTLTPTFLNKAAPKQVGKSVTQIYHEPETFSRKVEPPTGSLSFDAAIRQARAAGSGPLRFPSYPFRHSFTGLIYEPEFDDLRLSYEGAETNGTIVVTPRMPYLDAAASGKELIGFHYMYNAFMWGFPKFSVKTANNSDRSIYIGKITVRVLSSQTINTPIPVFRENWNRPGFMLIENHGFGEITNAHVTYILMELGDAEADSWSKATVRVPVTFSNGLAKLDIRSSIPEKLKDETALDAAGVIEYSDESGKHYRNTFRTRVGLRDRGPGAPMPPSAEYQIVLDPTRGPYTESINVSQVLKPKEFDNFVLRVGATRFAKFVVELSVIGITDEIMLRRRLDLTIFRPSGGVPLT